MQLGDLGTFYLAVKTEGSENEDKFSVNQNVKGLYLRFAPCRQDINDLSSKTLKKRASFMNVKELIESKTSGASSDGGTTVEEP